MAQPLNVRLTQNSPCEWPGFTPPRSRKMPPPRGLLLLRRIHHGIDQGDPPHRLQAVDNGAQSPVGKEAEDLFLDSLESPLRIRDGVDIVLKGDLLSGMFEGQSR